MRTAFASMRPQGWGGADGWAMNGPGVSAQSIADALLSRYAGHVDAAVWAWYPPESIVGVGTNATSTILRAYFNHKASPYKSAVKRTVYLQPFWIFHDGTSPSTANTAAYQAWLDTEMADPDWLRIDNRPVVFLFDVNGLAAHASVATWTGSWLPFLRSRGALLFALGGASTANLTAMGFDSRSNYGPSGATVVGTAQHTWQEQYTVDQAGWAPTGARTIPGLGLTPAGDLRMRVGDLNGDHTPSWGGYTDANGFVDPPLPFELFRAVETARAYPKAKYLTIYSGTEISEGGPGNLVGSVFRPNDMLDAIQWARDRGTRPSSYVFSIDTHNKLMSRTGTWTWTRDGALTIAGAFDDDEMRSSTAASTQTVTVPGATRLVLRGGKLSGGGTGTCTFDGGAPAAFSCANATTLVNQTLCDSGVVTLGSHTLVVTVDGTGEVRTDHVQATADPRAW